MTRPRRRIPSNPLFAWGLLAARYAEMAAASAHVISHRTRRPNTPAQLFEMGNEKMQAAMESSQAMARQWMGLYGSTDPVGAWVRLLSSGVAPYRARAVRNSRRARRG